MIEGQRSSKRMEQKPNITDTFGPLFNLKLETMIEGQDLVNEWNLQVYENWDINFFNKLHNNSLSLHKVYQSLTLR